VSRFLGYVVTGTANGTIYALVALGVVITYRVSRVINLAQGATGVQGPVGVQGGIGPQGPVGA